MRIGLCVPTLNAGAAWREWLKRAVRSLPANSRRLVVDSQSDDDTVAFAREAGFETIEIRRADFNHGGTRQLAVEHLSDCEIVVFLTQDALLVSQDSVRNLLTKFDNNGVGAAFGRQIPHASARPIGAHARVFNYPECSDVRELSDTLRLGIKTAFLSNSFAAYRVRALTAVGGFPCDVILGEDTVVAARMLTAGWKIAYSADATVQHSHDYTYLQEFCRYFDIGVFHSQEKWLLENFGKPHGEGRRFVISEIRYLMRHAPWLIPSAAVRTGLKYAGYRLGLAHERLPHQWHRRLSMHKGYWDRRRRM